MRETMRATINSFDLATVYARACTVQGGWWDNHPCKTLSKFTHTSAQPRRSKNRSEPTREEWDQPARGFIQSIGTNKF